MKHFEDQVVCPLWETGPGNLRNSEGAVIELLDGRLLLAYKNIVLRDLVGPVHGAAEHRPL